MYKLKITFKKGIYKIEYKFVSYLCNIYPRQKLSECAVKFENSLERSENFGKKFKIAYANVLHFLLSITQISLFSYTFPEFYKFFQFFIPQHMTFQQYFDVWKPTPCNIPYAYAQVL